MGASVGAGFRYEWFPRCRNRFLEFEQTLLQFNNLLLEFNNPLKIAYFLTHPSIIELMVGLNTRMSFSLWRFTMQLAQNFLVFLCRLNEYCFLHLSQTKQVIMVRL